MRKFKIVSSILLATTFFSCVGNPPTEFGRKMLQEIEAQKQTSGLYPENMEGNLANTNYKEIRTNGFFYLVDSARTSFTLKIFTEDGLADIYESKKRQWIRTDK